MSTLIERIHAAGRCGVLAVTGGGSLAISDLLTVPGASRTVLEAVVPYAATALDRFLGSSPERYCDAATARAMAMAAFWRAERQQLGEAQPSQEGDLDRIWGLGATCSLRSDRPKKGPHRAHVAIQTSWRTECWSIDLVKGARTRAEEERLVADLILQAVASACEVDVDSQEDVSGRLRAEESVDHASAAATDDWRDIVLGLIDAVCVLEPPEAKSGEPGGKGELPAGDMSPTSGVLFPGAFHPLHHGHRGMAEVARRRLGKTVEFEISIENVDKPPLDYLSIQERLAQFTEGDTVWLTRAPTFLEKARTFPGATFVVGADTIVRVAMPEYYADVAHRDAAVREIGELGCRFLVFCRRLADGTFPSFEQLGLPEGLASLCEWVPEEEFRDDISSTELRKAQAEPRM